VGALSRRLGAGAAAAGPRLSVVLATFNRPASLVRLLRQLAGQTLDPHEFEVVVVDDGSEPPVEAALRELHPPYSLTLVRQANAGAAAARHQAVLAARGEILVITDDDMQVPPEFLAAHLALHPTGSRRVVMGRMRDAPQLGQMPLFERFHARLLARRDPTRLRGNALCTGNASLRRADYLAVGGFDVSFRLSEDMDLGLRLEQAGVELLFSEPAYTVHHSDHGDFAAWRRRAFAYGQYDVRIARKYPRLAHADPWRFFFGNALAKRPFALAAAVSPRSARRLGDLVLRSALLLDRIGLGRLAVLSVGVLWELEYFAGVRTQIGALTEAWRSCAEFTEKAALAEPPLPGVGRASAVVGRALRAALSALGMDGRGPS
jgi:GT2 family glycosyltransferase